MYTGCCTKLKALVSELEDHLIKYQGVKEFHMLAHISYYCKFMVFSPFELGDTYCLSFKGNK